ncbi:MAG: SDR family NAD(P)-dependent oxidoreductase [Gammaproteobacteria bacterium]
MINNIAIIGSSGAIGNAFTQQLAALHPKATLHAFSRTVINSASDNVYYHAIDYKDETSIASSAALAAKDAPLDLVIVATGLLHHENIKPEKSLREISAEKMKTLFEVNTILPALMAKHFLPTLNKHSSSIFAALSARVGSISDNRLGGWYGYRASKAALNMIIKNAAIEIGRKNKQAIIVSLHPGTVDSDLSKPFQENVPTEKLFTPDFAVKKLLAVLNNLTPNDTGQCFAWDGVIINP